MLIVIRPFDTITSGQKNVSLIEDVIKAVWKFLKPYAL